MCNYCGCVECSHCVQEAPEGLHVLISNKHGEILEVRSDGEARYKITGSSLRDQVSAYETDDDLHVIGLVLHQLVGHNSMEYLRRRLNEHQATEAT